MCVQVLGLKGRYRILCAIVCYRLFLRLYQALKSQGLKLVWYMMYSTCCCCDDEYPCVLGPTGDRIFVSAEAMVKGFNRKGKQFLSFDTNLTEHIEAM